MKINLVNPPPPVSEVLVTLSMGEARILKEVVARFDWSKYARIRIEEIRLNGEDLLRMLFNQLDERGI